MAYLGECSTIRLFGETTQISVVFCDSKVGKFAASIKRLKASGGNLVQSLGDEKNVFAVPPNGKI